jgi:hypothetical protein
LDGDVSRRNPDATRLEQILQADFELLDPWTALDGEQNSTAARLEKCWFLLTPGSDGRPLIDQHDAVPDSYPGLVPRAACENGQHL